MRAQFSYDLLKLENDAAANMIYANGRLIHRTREEIGGECWSVSDKPDLLHTFVHSLEIVPTIKLTKQTKNNTNYL